MKTAIISLGGSLIVPREIDMGFLLKFRKVILDYAGKGNRIIIVCGGGGTNKDYNSAARKIARIDDTDMDWLGIAVTKLNAEFIRVIFGKVAYEKTTSNPTEKIKTQKKIIIASGWKPGWSTDYDSVQLAINFRSKSIINLTNVDYVYDKDPKKHKDAKIIKKISWDDYLKLVGKKWSPRMHAPFDPVASMLAKKYGIRIIIANGRNLKNLQNFLDGKKLVGTVIS